MIDKSPGYPLSVMQTLHDIILANLSKTNAIKVEDLILLTRHRMPAIFDHDELLEDTLRYLEGIGMVMLPARFWKLSGSEFRTKTITFQKIAKEKPVLELGELHPKMDFANKIVNSANKDDLIALNNWFMNSESGYIAAKLHYKKYHNDSHPQSGLMALRGRSQQIFRRDKYMSDKFKFTKDNQFLYRNEYLHLEKDLFTCVLGFPILRYKIPRNEGSKKNLLIENQTTSSVFALLCENGLLDYETIWFGSGNKITAKARAELPLGTEMFFDIDPMGLQMAHEMLEQGFPLATYLYELLLDCPGTSKLSAGPRSFPHEYHLFPRHIAAKIDALFQQGKTLVQEALNEERLYPYFSANPRPYRKEGSNSLIVLPEKLVYSDKWKKFFGFL